MIGKLFNGLLLILAITALIMLIYGVLAPAGGRLVPWYHPRLTHFLAFFVVAFLLGLVFRIRLSGTLVLVMVLSAFGGLLELLQMVVPRRTALFVDAMANAGGALTGGFSAWMLLRAVDWGCGDRHDG